MNDSQFSAIRIVALMLSQDGSVDAKEQQWFLWLMRSHELTADQRQILREDLKGKGRPEEILPRIVDPDDQQQLQRWARVAMRLDGVIDPAERRLFAQIQALVGNVGDLDHQTYRAAARELLEVRGDGQLWQELGEAAKEYSLRKSRYIGTESSTWLRRYGTGLLVSFALVLVRRWRLSRTRRRRG